MAGFSFGFSGDDFEQDESHPAVDIPMTDDAPSANAMRPEKHRIEDLVGSAFFPLPFQVPSRM
jgi:hypothetical protein